MKYKKKKYFKQNLDLKAIYLNTNFIFVFQLESIDINNWILLKKLSFKYNLKLKIYSIKFFKNNSFFVFKSELITKLYSGTLILIYAQNHMFDIDYINLKNKFLYFENLRFLICIYILFQKRFFLVNDFKKMISICIENSKLVLINLLSIKILSLLQLIEFKSN